MSLLNSVPVTMSSNDDLHSGCLRRLLGVMTISGFLNGKWICPKKENKIETLVKSSRTAIEFLRLRRWK